MCLLAAQSWSPPLQCMPSGNDDITRQCLSTTSRGFTAPTCAGGGVTEASSEPTVTTPEAQAIDIVAPKSHDPHYVSTN